MPRFELLTLDLRSPIEYGGLENPPLQGAPLSGNLLLPGVPASSLELGVGADMPEGDEELFLFDEASIVEYDPDDGPILRRPLPGPRYYGRRPVPGALAGLPPSRLEAGSYAFLQWRPRDEEELADGVEWFARECWWERVGALGPYALRRVREDGKLATQALRRLIK